jgi:predicted outer membrane repeat protein
VYDTVFEDNTAMSGGALYLYGTTAFASHTIISNCDIDGNTATYRGGGIYSRYRNLQLQDGTVIQNNSAAKGGGVFMNHGQIMYFGVSIGGNTASDSGDFGPGTGVYRLGAGRLDFPQSGGVTWFGNPANSEDGEP